MGYVVEGSDMRDARKVDATESDDAEVLAILFSIDELKDKLGNFVVVCDHESVVSEAKREAVRNPSRLMERLRRTLRDNPSIGLEVLKSNPAHGVVTEYVNTLKAGEGRGYPPEE